MKYEKGDLLTLDENDQYLVIDNILFEGIEYLFTNKFVGEEPTQDYAIYEVDNDDVIEVRDEEKIAILFPMFNKNIKKLLEDANNEKFNIE